MLDQCFIINPKSVKLKDLTESIFFYHGRIYFIVALYGHMRECCYYEDDFDDPNSIHTIFHSSVLVHSVDEYK